MFRRAIQTISEIQEQLKLATDRTLPELELRYSDDARKGVQRALESARKRVAAQLAEKERVAGLFRFERELAHDGVVIGLDEVGRGPLAGPLSVGAVVFDRDTEPIVGLNDSKQIPEAKRAEIAKAVREACRACVVVHVEAKEIDERGIMACLKKAFTQAIARIEESGVSADVVLLDGNPLGLDPREVNVVKGDAKCASIAAASVIAKVERDALMAEYDSLYPGYDLASSKGYGSAKHRAAIEERGLTPIHRASYCQNITQPKLFTF